MPGRTGEDDLDLVWMDGVWVQKRSKMLGLNMFNHEEVGFHENVLWIYHQHSPTFTSQQLEDIT
jgi:hypothetical protein